MRLIHTWAPWKFSGLTNYAHGYFSHNFSGAFVRIDPVNMRTKYEFRSFTRSGDNRRLEFRVGVANLQSRERGGRKGSEMVPSERALVNSYRSSIVTFPLSLRVSEILPLLFYRTPLLPYPPLVSPKFPHVPVGLGGSPFGDTDRRCWADSPCN